MESNSRATAAVMDLRQHSNVAGTAEGSRILETIAYLRPWRALAGAVSRTSTAPMDRLKMIMQIEDVSKKGMTIKEGIARMQAEGRILHGRSIAVLGYKRGTRECCAASEMFMRYPTLSHVL
eukprot:scaffold23889_cov20-Tisochrysis_lutea.AAC.1